MIMIVIIMIHITVKNDSKHENQTFKVFSIFILFLWLIQSIHYINCTVVAMFHYI